MDKVKITIRARQRGTDGRLETVKHQAEGSYMLKGSRHYIRYLDKHLDPKGHIPTTIKVGEGELVILRQGLVTARQAFRLGCETRSGYETPYGNMELVMHTHRLESDFGEDKGIIHLDYSLNANGSQVGEYELEIRLAAI